MSLATQDPFDLVSAAPDFDAQEWAAPLASPVEAKPQQKPPRKKRPRSPSNGTSLHLDDMDAPRPPAKSASIPPRPAATGFARLGTEPLQSIVVQTIPDMVLSEEAIDAMAALLRHPRPLCSCEECVERFKRVIAHVRNLFCHLAEHEPSST